jgi:hypothetical protein
MTRSLWPLEDGLEGSRTDQSFVGLFSQGLRTGSLWRNAAQMQKTMETSYA